MRVGIVGLGTAGGALACLLHDRGHEVTVLERATDPGPVGAGIWLQELGQEVLDRLGLLEDLRAASPAVSRVEIAGPRGSLVAVGYDDLPGAVPALGVHRGTLFTLLHRAVAARGIPIELGVHVTGVRPTRSGAVVETADGPRASYDLVVGADGSGSRVRSALGVARRDRHYEYGALWAIVDDHDGLAGDRLYQRLEGTRRYLGVLPTGHGRASLFWSVKRQHMPGVLDAGLAAWRDTARSLAGPYAPLLDEVTELLPASYRDVVVRTPYRHGDGCAAVLVGDAAHAMSPQLGVGTSLALADAWALAQALDASPGDLPAALRSYAADRAAHLRWYQWWTRLMMPVFQSDLLPLAWPRDLLAPVVAGAPGMPALLVGTLCGDRTSPWRTWSLTGD